MREAKIILPVVRGKAKKVTRAHTAQGVLQKALTDRFGGYTRHYAYGSWLDASGKLTLEAVEVYIVAGENTLDNCGWLRRIAQEAGELAGQEAMYVRDFSGRVTILPVKPEEDA